MRISDWSSDVCSSDLLKPLLCDVAGVGFQQDVAAAAQVEAEVYLFARHESGPFRNHFLREEVGNCEHQSDKDGKEYPPGLPGRKVEHGLTTGLIVVRAAARWPNAGKRAFPRATRGVGGHPPHHLPP